MPYLPYKNKLKDFPRTTARIAIDVIKPLLKKRAGFDSNAYGYTPPSGGPDPATYSILKHDCSEGDASAIIGLINSANTTFATSEPYKTTTLMVFLNGMLQCRGAGNDWTETDETAGTFDFVAAPDPGDIISAFYEQGI